MKFKKILAVLMTAGLLLTSFAACGGGASNSSGEGEGEASTEAEAEAEVAETISVGLVTDVGGVNDQSFNQSAWEGLQRFRADTGSKVSYIESKDESGYAPNIETFIDQGTNLIWGVGFMLGDAFAQAGLDNPDQQFALVDYAYAPEDIPNKNVTGVVFATEECSFLVGYVAGKMSETGKVGHINGIASSTMETFAVGYYAGVLTANPDVQIMGQYSNSFSDPAAGKNIANQYYADGVDIIFSAAGATGNGAIEAAKEQGKWAIGVDMDQNYIAPDNVLTSALKRVDNALYDVSTKMLNGTFEGGGTEMYNLKNDGVGYATTGDHIPADILAEVEAVKNDIIAGNLKVPATAAELEAQFPGKYDMPPVEEQ
ncbi:MAG: BMP family ABC transporter substrate-binding protein [Clostridiales Family XIII bacterium]|jgi:basic membrane protein A|nr:BMP family ABC transporter substrate-binding protein [Clostridiales Family XIII bacterium]